jgi:hypothetical protein
MAAVKIGTLDINFHWNQRTLKFADFVGSHFEIKNDPECNFHHYQSISHFKITLDINFGRMAAVKIGKISMFSDFNENLYLVLFWSEELIGNDENCIQGHF